jgi:Asp-tRNA(Asn)/Glu-tRNA(Gln) amidotransferase C subunit
MEAFLLTRLGHLEEALGNLQDSVLHMTNSQLVMENVLWEAPVDEVVEDEEADSDAETGSDFDVQNDIRYCVNHVDSHEERLDEVEEQLEGTINHTSEVARHVEALQEAVTEIRGGMQKHFAETAKLREDVDYLMEQHREQMLRANAMETVVKGLVNRSSSDSTSASSSSKDNALTIFMMSRMEAHNNLLEDIKMQYNTAATDATNQWDQFMRGCVEEFREWKDANETDVNMFQMLHLLRSEYQIQMQDVHSHIANVSRIIPGLVRDQLQHHRI